MESSLSYTRDNLRQAVSYYLGYGADITVLSSDQSSTVDLCIKSGLNLFYNPPPLTELGEREAHVWSFLYPTYHLPIAAGIINYDLPDDWGGFRHGYAYLDSSSNQPQVQVVTTSVSKILNNRQALTNAVTGPPQMIADRVIPGDGETPTRYELLVWPTPDLNCTMLIEYRSNPNNISSTQTYPLGGQPHSETLRAACIAAAERDVDEIVLGPRWQDFKQRLGASVSYDRNHSGPRIFGYNADRTTNPMSRRGVYPLSYVTYNHAIPT